MLYQGNVIAVFGIDLRGIKFPEAVRADIFKAQVVASHFKNGLCRAFRDRENPFILSYLISQTVVFDVLKDREGDCESPGLICLFFSDVQPVPASILDEVGQAQLEDVTDPEAEICFYHKGGCHTGVWPHSGKAPVHGFNDFFVLLRRQSYGFFIQTSTFSSTMSRISWPPFCKAKSCTLIFFFSQICSTS